MKAAQPGTFACLLTAPSSGAIAVVNVWGAGAVAAVDALFRPNTSRKLADTPPGRPRVGRMGRGLGDEVVTMVLDAPPCVEIQCHGGPAAVELVLDSLRGVGVRIVSPIRWLIASHPGRIEAEAAWCLARATTRRTAAILLDQVNGGLRRGVAAVVDFLDRSTAAETASQSLSELCARWLLGAHLLVGWRVALCGRPNVGKSCLLNALAGFERAIVDPTPGTTRDVITTATAFDGWPIELVDTAGVRESLDAIEAAGIARARARHAAADLLVVVLDLSQPLIDDDVRLMQADGPKLLVANKADLPAAWDPEHLGAIRVSALSGAGLEGLVARIAGSIVAPPRPGTAVPFRRRHIGLIQQAADALSRGDCSKARVALERLLGDKPAGIQACC